MAPPGWATPEERLFLSSLIPEYETCQVKRRYKPFWQRLNAEFLTKFPVIDKLFPGMKITDLTVKQKQMHTAAVVKQQQVSLIYSMFPSVSLTQLKRLKEWFRWQMNPRSRNTGSVLTKKDLRNIYQGPHRTHKPYKVFARIYSEDVERAKIAHCKVEGISGRRTLNVWQDVSRKLYEAASEDRRDAMKKAIQEEAMGEDMDTDNAETPNQYLRLVST